MYRYLAIIILLCNALPTIGAGVLLTQEDAVRLALKHNYDISIAYTQAQTAHIRNAPGNAGMLPSVALTGADAYEPANSGNQKPASGAVSHYSNSYNNTVNAGLALSWMLFDGGRMFLVKRSLNSLDSLGSIQLKNSVLQTVYDVVVAYYDIVQQKQQLVSVNEVIAYNKERVLILQTSFNAGLIPKTTLLQAQIDLNVYRENALAQQAVIVSAKRTLLQLLGNGTDTTFEVVDSIPLDYTPDKNELINNVYAHNTLLQAARKKLDIAKLAVKDAESQKYPRVTLNGGYGFSQMNNGTGATRMSRAWGPQVGAGISIPLYQAGAVSRLAAIAQLQVQSDSADFDNVKRTLTLEMDNALMAFENQQALLTIEKENELLAKENLDIEFQRLRLGQSTSLEMHQAEESYKESQTRLISIRFNQKIAETKLRQLLAELEQ